MSSLSLKERFLQLLWTRKIRPGECTHLDAIQPKVQPTSRACEQCVSSGDLWIGLRMCATCGYVGCCETSKNHHSRSHFEQTGHPIIYSDPINPSWIWCYLDKTLIEHAVRTGG